MNKPHIKVVCDNHQRWWESPYAHKELRKRTRLHFKALGFPVERLKLTKANKKPCNVRFLRKWIGRYKLVLSLQKWVWIPRLLYPSCSIVVLHTIRTSNFLHIDACWLKPDDFPQLNWAAACRTHQVNMVVHTIRITNIHHIIIFQLFIRAMIPLRNNERRNTELNQQAQCCIRCVL